MLALTSPIMYVNSIFKRFVARFIVVIATSLAMFNPYNLNAQLKFGETYYIKNLFETGSFLETCGNSDCTTGAKYNVLTNSEKNRLNAKTGQWVLVSAEGKTNGQPVVFGDVVYLKNKYDDQTYLDACGHSTCTTGSRYEVVTNSLPDRTGHATGKWILKSALCKPTGEVVSENEDVFIQNLYAGGSFLDTCDYTSCTSGTLLNVVTHSSSDRGSNTSKWHFSNINARSVGTSDALSLFEESYTNVATPNSYFVVCSDPQWYFARSGEQGMEPDEKKKLATLRLSNSVRTINALHELINLDGVVINGDLTRLGSERQLEKFESIYRFLKPQIFLGLGNHDYQNNLPDDEENAARMVNYLINQVNSLKDKNNSVSFDYSRKENSIVGSLAYSWDIGNIHFVQLNNHPGYDNSWTYNGIEYVISPSGFELKAFNLNRLEFQSGWLGRDLEKATRDKKQIILNFHKWDPIGGFPLKNDVSKLSDRIVDQINAIVNNDIINSNVIAIFTGHYHETFGRVGRILRTDRTEIPVFRSGAVFYDNYLLLSFYNDRMSVSQGTSDGRAPEPAGVMEWIKYM